MTEVYESMDMPTGYPDQEGRQDQQPERKKIANYWGVDQTERFMFPDGEQWMEFRIMNEGHKSQFQKTTNKDLTVTRNNDAKIAFDQALERHQLIKLSVINWHMYAPDKQTGQMAITAFSKQLLEKWLEVADPKIVEDLEKAIRKANPWMASEVTIEGIDEEIERLYEQRKELVAKQTGEAYSANK